MREATTAERKDLHRRGQIFPSFVAETGGRCRLVIDYKRANECLERRTFRMDQLADLALELEKGGQSVQSGPDGRV